ncbi:MAG: low molecular weight phosphatase family protein [Rhodothalassiaceae bacterium]
MAKTLSSLLFACGVNGLRSPMAAGLARRRLGRDVFITSAGVTAAERMDPFAVTVCAEIGVDIAAHRPRAFEDLEDTSFDLIISLTPEAHHRAAVLTRTWAAEIEYWPTADPSVEARGQAREAVLDAYRATRDRLQTRIEARFDAAVPAAG